MKRWRGLKQLVQSAVDSGATAIQQVHLRTSATPFNLLEKVPGLASPVRGIREVHDLAVASSYSMVRLVNRVVGKAVDVALDVLEKSRPPPPAS